MSDHRAKGSKENPSEEREEIVLKSAAPPKSKQPELSDIFETMRALKVEDLADPRVGSILLQLLLEKIDRIRILDSENSKLRSEKETLAIESARQDEQLRVTKKSHVMWALVAVVGGLTLAASLTITDNIPVLVLMVVGGLFLSAVGAIGTRT